MEKSSFIILKLLITRNSPYLVSILLYPVCYMHVAYQLQGSRMLGWLHLRNKINPLNVMKLNGNTITVTMVDTKSKLKILIWPFELGSVSNMVKMHKPRIIVIYATVGFKRTPMLAQGHMHTSQFLFGFLIVSPLPLGQTNEGPWMK